MQVEMQGHLSCIGPEIESSEVKERGAAKLTATIKSLIFIESQPVNEPDCLHVKSLFFYPMSSDSSVKRIFSGSAWGIMAKILDAAAKFVTIPLLVGYYGKVDYGLIALAFSLNAYLRLMDLGMNVGSVRFFSMWV